MKLILFTARIALFYNLCFLITVVLRYYDFIPDREIKSGIIVAGYILSLITNITIHSWVAVLVIGKKSFSVLRPAWLFIANAVFFIAQIYFLTR